MRSKRRAERCAAFEHQINALVIDVAAMLHAVNAGQNRSFDAGLPVRMRGRLFARAVRLVNCRGHFFQIQLRELRAGVRVDASSCHDFHEIRAALDLLARGLFAIDGSVALTAGIAAMSAGHAQALPGNIIIRADKQSLIQCIFQINFRELASVHIPYKRHAGLQLLL